MTYQMLVLKCDYCSQEFDPAKIGFNAVGGILMAGTCPGCGLKRLTETTVEDVIQNVQAFEIDRSVLPDLAEIIVTGRIM